MQMHENDADDEKDSAVKVAVIVSAVKRIGEGCKRQCVYQARAIRTTA